jgi:hypothetical protein
MCSTSTLKPHVVVPADFADDPISRFWRGIMFGWDANRDLEFDGLVPRMRTTDEARWIVRWADYEPVRFW